MRVADRTLISSNWKAKSRNTKRARQAISQAPRGSRSGYHGTRLLRWFSQLMMSFSKKRVCFVNPKTLEGWSG